MMGTFAALLLALLSMAPAFGHPHDKQVLVRIGGEVFDPTDPDARGRFGTTAESQGDPVGWIVQFQRPLTVAERNHLGAEYGFSLEAFVPDNAYLVWMPQENIERLAATETELYRGHVRYGPLLRRAAWLQEPVGSSGAVQDSSSAAVSGDKPRHWTEVFGDTSAGKDSNVELVGDDSTPMGSKRDFHAVGSVGVDYRRTKLRSNDKLWELGLAGQTTWIEQQDLDSSSRFDLDVGGYLDLFFRPMDPSNDGKPLEPTPRYSAGLLFRHAEIRLEDGRFQTVNQTVLGTSISFSQWDECELNRIFAFVSFEEVDDRQSESDPVFDRDGHNTGVGIRGSLGPDAAELGKQRCLGGGTFRKLFLDRHRVMHGSYQHRWENTYGTEFRRRIDILETEGQWPLISRQLDSPPLVSLDLKLSYERARHKDTSSFALKSRSDNVRIIDAGLIFPLMLQSDSLGRGPLDYVDLYLRIGAQYTDHASNIDLFQYTRMVYGANLRIIFGHQNRWTPRKPTNPGTTDGLDSGSGPRRPRPNGG